MHYLSYRPRKICLINQLTLDKHVFQTKTNILQSFFHVTDVSRLQIFCNRLLSIVLQVETTVMDLSIIPCTQESSVLTKADMSFSYVVEEGTSEEVLECNESENMDLNMWETLSSCTYFENSVPVHSTTINSDTSVQSQPELKA